MEMDLGSRKTINLPGTPVSLPALKEKDINDLITACEHDYDLCCNVIYEEIKDDIDQVRKVLDENGGKDIKIITKVENVEGLENMEEIVENADAQNDSSWRYGYRNRFYRTTNHAKKKFIKIIKQELTNQLLQLHKC